ncbi:MAG TPA: MMPL family transporter [Ktedonobacterales bacterium]|nr:MMPL family transporter [Ktedonobacterales bacterium]
MTPDTRSPDAGEIKQTPEPSATQEPQAPATPPAALAHIHTDSEVHGIYRFGLGYGRLVHKLRWLIVAVWLVGLVAAVPFAAQVTSVLSGGGYSYSGSESVKANNIVAGKLKTPDSTLLVVFQSTDGSRPTDASYQLEVANFMARARALPNVTSVQQGGVGQDNATTYVNVNFDKNAPGPQALVERVQDILPEGDGAVGLKTYITGGPAVEAAFNEVTRQDTERAELYAMPIALLALLIIFGSVVAAFLPLTLAAVAVPVALAAIYAIASNFDTNIFVLNIASIVGLGISIDYSLFMVRRFREELARGRSVRDAVGWTVATSGEAILFSGLTVIIGFAGLLLIGIQFMSSFGIGGALTVAAAMLAALTLLPALLAILGPRVNALRVPYLWKLVGVGSRRTLEEDAEEATETTSGFWARLAEGVMRRPLATILLVTGLLLAMGWPLLNINIGSISIKALPASIEARQGNDILNAQFPETAANPIVIVAQTPDGSSILSSANVAKVDQLTQWLDAQRGVTSVTSVTQFPGDPRATTPTLTELQRLYSTGAYQQVPGLPQLVGSTTSGDTTVITVKTNAELDSAESKALVDRLRAGDNAHAGGLKVLVGGYQAVSLDFTRYLYDNFPRAILFVLGATFVLLLIMFRSLLLPLKAVIVNALSISAAYGAVVFVFQWGFGQNLLDFTSTGFVDSLVPILMFCILFGLSMDYEVFLLSRIREEWERSKNNRLAVARGLERTGGVITSAALLFIIVTGAFTFTRTIVTKEIGLGMTIAVLVDATIIRSLLVPAAMRLMGRWNWWLPGRPIPPKQVGDRA